MGAVAELPPAVQALLDDDVRRRRRRTLINAAATIAGHLASSPRYLNAKPQDIADEALAIALAILRRVP